MKSKFLAVVGALISLAVSACEKPASTIKNKDADSAQNSGNVVNVTVEDYVDNIIEYEIYDFSHVTCTKYGPQDSLYDVCGNDILSNNDCGLKQRYTTKGKTQCEEIDNKTISKCNKAIMANPDHPETATVCELGIPCEVASNMKLADVPHKTQKYSVSVNDMDVKLTYCDENERKNKTQSIKAGVRKECLIDNNGVTNKCECIVVKDNCGNSIGNGTLNTQTPGNKDNNPNNDEKTENSRCLGHIGKVFDCNNPVFFDFSNTKNVTPHKPR